MEDMKMKSNSKLSNCRYKWTKICTRIILSILVIFLVCLKAKHIIAWSNTKNNFPWEKENKFQSSENLCRHRHIYFNRKWTMNTVRGSDLLRGARTQFLLDEKLETKPHVIGALIKTLTICLKSFRFRWEIRLGELMKSINILQTNCQHLPIQKTFPRRKLTNVSSALPPFSLIRDFGKQNTRGNVSKISVNLTCYRHIRSKSTNHSPLTWRREGQKVTLAAVIGGFRSDLSITRKTDGNFGNVSASVLFSKVVYQRKRWYNTFDQQFSNKERVIIYCLNEKWSLTELVVYFFARRELQTKNISQATCQHVPIHRTFYRGKISKHEWRPTETTIYIFQGKKSFAIWMDNFCQIDPERFRQ